MPSDDRSARLVRGSAAWAATLILVFPVFWMLLTALKPNPEVLGAPPRLLPSRPTLDNFLALVRAGSYETYLGNSVLVAACTAALATGVSAVAAYSLTRFEYRAKGTIGYLILFTYMFPPILLAIPLFLFFGRLRLTDSYTGLVLAHVAYALPFCLWILRDFFATIPRQLEYAARIDGASAPRAVWSVVLPLAWPGIGAALVFAFVLSWSDYLFALVFVSSDELKTLPLVISNLVSVSTTDWGMVVAATTLVTIPPLVAVLFLQRFLLRGFGIAGV